MTEITRMQTIFLVLKHPKNMHIEFLSISEVTAGKRHDFISNQGKAFAHWSGMTVSTRDGLHNSSFFSNQHTPIHFLQINTPTSTLTLHCSSTMVGGHEKQIDSNLTSTPSSASAHQQCPQIGTLHHLCKMSGLIHIMLG